MAKNLIIIALVITVTNLVGIIMITNTELFSQEWLIGLGIIIGTVSVAGILIYSKIRK
ncbi:MAG: hypothetical protein HC944_03355 [Nanoarchaeota archaeon]|nr:hypothetical protein [Nanoarchaeota archaeon]